MTVFVSHSQHLNLGRGLVEESLSIRWFSISEIRRVTITFYSAGVSRTLAHIRTKVHSVPTANCTETGTQVMR